MAKESKVSKEAKNNSEAVAKKPLLVIPEPTEKDLAEENKQLKEQNREYQRLLEKRVDNGFFPLISIKDSLMESVQDLEKLINNRDGILHENVLTGFGDLDALTNGFYPGEYIVLASRPGVGKSCLASNILTNVALRCHKRMGGEPRVVALFSLETTAKMVTDRIVCAEAGINYQQLCTGRMSDNNWESLWLSCDKCSKTKLFISDKSDISFEEIRNKVLRLKAIEGLDFLVIDSVQLLHLARWSGDYRDRTVELSEISYRLKLLARELNIPVLVLSQLSRNVESRNVKRPRLSDLRDSGSLEEDADLVLLLYREDYYDPDTENKHTELIVAKNRFGPTDVVNLFFHKYFCKFVGFTKRQD